MDQEGAMIPIGAWLISKGTCNEKRRPRSRSTSEI